MSNQVSLGVARVYNIQYFVVLYYLRSLHTNVLPASTTRAVLVKSGVEYVQYKVRSPR